MKISIEFFINNLNKNFFIFINFIKLNIGLKKPILESSSILNEDLYPNFCISGPKIPITFIFDFFF